MAESINVKCRMKRSMLRGYEHTEKAKDFISGSIEHVPLCTHAPTEQQYGGVPDDLAHILVPTEQSSSVNVSLILSVYII